MNGKTQVEDDMPYIGGNEIERDEQQEGKTGNLEGLLHASNDLWFAAIWITVAIMLMTVLSALSLFLPEDAQPTYIKVTVGVALILLAIFSLISFWRSVKVMSKRVGDYYISSTYQSGTYPIQSNDDE